MVNRIVFTVLTASVLFTFNASVYADHSWNNYHWARTANSFELTVVKTARPQIGMATLRRRFLIGQHLLPD